MKSIISSDDTSSLSAIDKFLLGSNLAHDIASLVIDPDHLTMTLEDCNSEWNKKTFVFNNPKVESQLLMLQDGEELEYPLPLIGAESTIYADQNRHRFLFNFSDFGIVFYSEWPYKEN